MGTKIIILKITLIFFLIFTATCFADVPLEIINNSNSKKIVRVKWVNNPYGCYIDLYGIVNCEYFIAVAEIQPNKVFSMNLSKEKRIYCIIWDDIEFKPCFTMELTMKSIRVTTNTITIFQK